MRHFCMHLDTSESSLEMKVPGQSTVESAIHSHRFTHVLHTLLICSHMLCIRYAYVTNTLAYVMHTLLIRYHTLCIRYSYAHIRYAYITHTVVYATHTVINATMTDRRRWLGLKHSKVVRIHIFYRNFHNLLICSIIRCSVTAP